MSALFSTARTARASCLAPQTRAMSMLLNRSLKVSDILEQHDEGYKQTVDKDDNLANAMHSMSEHSVGCVAVMDEGKVSGMLSERDVLSAVGGSAGVDPQTTNVGTVASMGHAASRFATPIYTARQCLSLMVENRWRHMPVVTTKTNDAEYLGMVSILDVVLLGMKPDIAPSTPAMDGSATLALQVRVVVSGACMHVVVHLRLPQLLPALPHARWQTTYQRTTLIVL